MDMADVKDWHGRPVYELKDGKWKEINYKDIKKSGGEWTESDSKEVFPFAKKDKVWVDGVSTVSGAILKGWYLFDSFDAYDGSCYVTKRFSSNFYWNVSMDEIYMPDSSEHFTYLENQQEEE